MLLPRVQTAEDACIDVLERHRRVALWPEQEEDSLHQWACIRLKRDMDQMTIASYASTRQDSYLANMLHDIRSVEMLTRFLPDLSNLHWRY